MNDYKLHDHRWINGVVGVLAAATLSVASGCASSPFSKVVSEKQTVTEQVHDEAQAAHETEPDVQSLLAAAHAQWRTGQIDGCRDTLQQILEADPDQQGARRMLADLYLEQGDFEASEGQLRQLLRQRPDDPMVHLSLGLLMEQAGRDKESKAHLQRVAALDPENRFLMSDRRPSSPAAQGVEPAPVSRRHPDMLLPAAPVQLSISDQPGSPAPGPPTLADVPQPAGPSLDQVVLPASFAAPLAP